jgi:hypothetical protein
MASSLRIEKLRFISVFITSKTGSWPKEEKTPVNKNNNAFKIRLFINFDLKI